MKNDKAFLFYLINYWRYSQIIYTRISHCTFFKMVSLNQITKKILSVSTENRKVIKEQFIKDRLHI